MSHADEQIAPDQPESSTEGSTGTVFKVLSNTRRRYVLEYLKDTDSPVTFPELVEHVAARENDVPPPELVYKQRKRVRSALYQTHLPMLDESGFIDYDRRKGIIELPGQSSSWEIYLDLEPTVRNPWPVLYAGVGLAGLVVALWTYLGFEPFTLVPPIVHVIALSVLVLGLATAELYYNRRGPTRALSTAGGSGNENDAS